MIEKKDMLELGLEFTETYKKYKQAHPAVREIICLKLLFPSILGDLRVGDLFAGRDNNYGPIGFIPHGSNKANGFLFYCDEKRLQKMIDTSDVSDEMLKKLQEAKEYWKLENTTYKTRNAFSEKIAKALPSDNFTGEAGIAFPLYRIGGVYLNFDKLVTIGIPGMMEEIEQYIAHVKSAGGDIELYTSMKMALELMVDVCKYYANQAKEFNRIDIAQVLEKIILRKPETLREAIQLSWIYTMMSTAINHGRMDVYLGDFYVKDIDSGAIPESEAIDMVETLWRMIAERHTIWNSRVIIGGMGRRNEVNADRFALAAIEATRRVKEIEPQLSLRFYKGMNPLLMEKALVAIGEGRTYPILYNDDVNVPSVVKAFAVSREEALQYVPYGCGEFVLNHRSFGAASGIINLTKAVESVLHNGKDPTTGKMIGLQTGEFKDFKSFEEFFDAYKKQVTFFIEALADQEELEYKVAGENASFLYINMLYDSVLESGKGVFSGGAHYLGGTCELYGNTNAADSLTAIKHLIYDKKVLTPEKMLEALDANFEGYEKEQALMKQVSKYGNDESLADDMAILHHEFVCNIVREQKNRTNLHSYLAVVINNDANTTLGYYTSASADGRKAGKPLANANTPYSGNDKNGITAVMNSQVKLDSAIHAGSVQNMKFSRELFNSDSRIVQQLLETYFDKGGTQAMITVVNKGDLEKAMKEPENYRHVFVRVGGFSARFVDLGRDVQLEILSRTLY